MMNIYDLRKLNPEIKIYSVNDTEFLKFGRVINDIDTSEIIRVAEDIEKPLEGTIYEASTPAFETLKIAKEIIDKCYGELPAQIGYCYGHSNFLNAFEWHTSSEVNIAITDLILLLADLRDIKNNTIDSSKAMAFYLKKGDIVEVFSTTLHFCPCEVEKRGFGCVVALPKGTNTLLEEDNDNPYLFRKNKWIIAHNENYSLIKRGAIAGISGKNIQIKY